MPDPEGGWPGDRSALFLTKKEIFSKKRKKVLAFIFFLRYNHPILNKEANSDEVRSS